MNPIKYQKLQIPPHSAFRRNNSAPEFTTPIICKNPLRQHCDPRNFNLFSSSVGQRGQCLVSSAQEFVRFPAHFHILPKIRFAVNFPVLDWFARMSQCLAIGAGNSLAQPGKVWEKSQFGVCHWHEMSKKYFGPNTAIVDVVIRNSDNLLARRLEKVKL